MARQGDVAEDVAAHGMDEEERRLRALGLQGDDGRGAAAGIRRPRSRAARPSMVGLSKRRVSGSACPSRAARIRRAGGARASSEWPPRAKKSSRTPTAVAPSTSCQISASCQLQGVAGRRRAARRWRRLGVRRRQGLAVHLAVRGERQGVEEHEGGRHHVVRQPLAAGARAASPAVGGPRGARRRRPAAASPAPAASAQPRPPPRAPPGWRGERRLDLPQLDAEAADLDLVVEPARGTRARRPAGARARSPVR